MVTLRRADGPGRGNGGRTFGGAQRALHGVDRIAKSARTGHRSDHRNADTAGSHSGDPPIQNRRSSEWTSTEEICGGLGFTRRANGLSCPTWFEVLFAKRALGEEITATRTLKQQRQKGKSEFPERLSHELNKYRRADGFQVDRILGIASIFSRSGGRNVDLRGVTSDRCPRRHREAGRRETRLRP